jgi:alpha-glucosidase
MRPWREGVLYQVYPRSFADSNGDGVGDLPGVLSRLDHLAWLGVDGIWLSPIFPSPDVDWGYDVSDYTDVHPELGTLDDLDRLVAEARRRGMRVLLDLVPNHTSDRHPWFSERPELYVWSDGVPNNWRSVFTGGSAWRRDRGRYYLHQFAPQQPDLDWWNPDVRAEFERILRFWFDRGVGGFRIDAAHSVVKDAELRDDDGETRNRTTNQPGVHQLYRRWQRITREYDPKPLLVGETYVPLDELVRYYGDGTDELDLPQNFPLAKAEFELAQLRAVVEETEAKLPPGATPCWFGSSHDISRLATRWAGGDERQARAALFLLLTLRGVPILYQGDEIALLDGSVPPERVTDVADPPRDPSRTPMPWTASGAEWRDPWLPLADTSRNVEEQLADPASTLHFVRDLIRRRRGFAGAPYETLPSEAPVWAYRRGPVTCLLNLSDEPARHGGERLAPWEGRILPPQTARVPRP